MKKYYLLTLFFVLVVTVAYFIIDYPKPPLVLQYNARKALHQAKLKRADQLATDTLIKAQQLYDLAMYQWGEENKKFILSRDYTEMHNQLEKSIVASLAANNIASIQKYKLSLNYEKQVADIHQLFSFYGNNFNNFPLHQSERKALNLAKLTFEECLISIKNNRFEDINLRLANVKVTIDSMVESYTAILNQYFEDYEEWESISLKSIQYSRQKKAKLIIVDKYNRLCFLYDKGKLQATYEMELGINWIGDKLYAGDKTTPEGVYKVILKKEGGQTKYQKALLLNYPNEDDLKRHLSNKKEGIIPKDFKVGGDIEIHGMGGKGTDWTDGCVALANQDMEELYKMVTTGTPVIIVGSTKPLNEVLK